MEKEAWRSEYEQLVLSGNIEKAKEIVKENAKDKYLLKFFRGTKLNLKSICNSQFWLSNAKFFNDPYDSLSLASVRSQLEYNRYNPEERQLAIIEYDKQVKSNQIAYDFQSNVFVTCFSEVGIDNLHMWSYYADDHKGFCAEYSLEKLINKGFEILPVVYVKSWESNRNITDYNTQIALIKGEGWSQEKEWRIVSVDPSKCAESGLKKDGILPEKIYFGCRDQEHTDDNWKQYFEIESLLLGIDEFNSLDKYAKSRVIQHLKSHIFNADSIRISLDDVLDMHKEFGKWFKENNIPVFSMIPEEGTIGLRGRHVIY